MRIGTVFALLLAHAHATPQLQNLPKFYMQSHTGGTGHAVGGHAWYQRQFSLIHYEPEDGEGTIVTNFGMSGSWMQPWPVEYPSNPCGGGSGGGPSRPVDYMTFEGGSSYAESVFGREPKWKVGDSVGCYRAYTQSSMFHTAELKPHACSWEDSDKLNPNHKRSMGLAQLSNRLLLFPDGQSFEREGMLGVSYARTPFGKLNATDRRNFWSVIIDSENYAGPVAYFLPEFWKLRPKGQEEKMKDYQDFSNSQGIQMTASPAWECHAMPNYVDGDVHKLIKMSAPQRNGRTVLWMGQRAHGDSELMDPLEGALSSGALDLSRLLRDGVARPSCQGSGDAKFGSVAAWATYDDVIENGDCLWTLKVRNSSCPRDGVCDVPQYYKSGESVDPSQASAALRSQRFPTRPFDQKKAYDALSQAPKGGCRDSPGPADGTLYSPACT